MFVSFSEVCASIKVEVPIIIVSNKIKVDFIRIVSFASLTTYIFNVINLIIFKNSQNIDKLKACLIK